MRRARGMVARALLAVLAVLVAGRLAWLPVAVFVVSGNSMVPTLRTGDLALGVATYLTDYDVGDIVVWYATITHGVIHRVVNVTESRVVTMGDNNPLPDPPVPRHFVKYKVVCWVPREAWLPGLAVAVAANLYASRRRLLEALRSPSPERLTVAFAVVVTFVVLDSSVILLSSVYYQGYRVVVERPAVELVGVELSRDGSTMWVRYFVRGATPVGVAYCAMNVSGQLYACRATVSGATVTIHVRREVYLHAYRVARSPVSKLSAVINVTFDKGWVLGVYSVAVNWRPLTVVPADSSVVVCNPNPVPFNVSVTATYYERVRGEVTFVGRAHVGSFTVPPGGSVRVPIERRGTHAYVSVVYEYKFARGGRVHEVKRVEFGG